MAESEEIELSLGLSLNGRFGVNPKSPNLIRSSSSISMSNFLEIPNLPSSQNPPLTRTCSLPVEVETKKRKEIQMLRRMEAKRKRSEKQRREIVVGEGKMGLNCGKFEFLGNNGGDKNGIFGVAPPLLLSQGSSASSSGTSELESQTPPPPPLPPHHHQGMNKNAEAKSPQSVQSFSDQHEHKPILWPGDPKRLKKTTSVDTTTVNTRLNPSRSISETSNVIKNVLTDMPCVSTKEEGPNGKRVEGFLYRYRKGEEVRIVCVCHGSFLTPAEFIKHAGVGDVEHPLRHIVVKPSPFV